MSIIGKTLVSFLVVIFLISITTFQPITVNAQSRTLVVPDQYPTIQSAIDNASTGDTVFVKKGTYYVNSYESSINVNKSLNLVGEGNNQTIINGTRRGYMGSPVPYDRPAIYISASKVTISGFSITNSFYGISIPSSKAVESKIFNDYIYDNDIAIHTEEENEGLEITSNIVANNSVGIWGYFTNSVISNNTISGNRGAITAQGEFAYNLTIKNNIIVNNHFGVNLASTSNVEVYGNRISQTRDSNGLGIGIQLLNVNSSVIYRNIIEQTDVGVYLPNYLLRYGQGSGSQVYDNNFIDNIHNAEVEHQYPSPDAFKALQDEYKTSAFNGTDIVAWDNGTIGNYWSDYNGNGSYAIDSNNVDYHPLTQKMTVPELSWLAVVLLLLSLFSVAVILRHRKPRLLSNIEVGS
jgi:parallel beta-helix repeat protein